MISSNAGPATSGLRQIGSDYHPGNIVQYSPQSTPPPASLTYHLIQPVQLSTYSSAAPQCFQSPMPPPAQPPMQPPQLRQNHFFENVTFPSPKTQPSKSATASNRTRAPNSALVLLNPKVGQKRPSTAELAQLARRVRPKVIPEKGSIQCEGTNQKKSCRCRNAALMEYIGPRPVYCAEHIEQDPGSLYAKCRSDYQRVSGDKKGCKEIVLKDFVYCYKHYSESLSSLSAETTAAHFERVQDICMSDRS